MFGGCGCTSEGGTVFNDLYTLEISSEPFRWNKVEAKGTVPPGRYRHSATAIDETRMLVFGGMSKNQRFDDCHIFTIDSEGGSTWSEPQYAGSPGVPRGQHSANLWKGCVVFFGGYGGAGQARMFLNEVHVLDLAAQEWQKPVPKGNPPRPRSSHSATLVEKQNLYVIGGRDQTTNFDDMHILELPTMTWSQAEPVLPEPCTGLLASAIESVPSYKLFIFGGQTSSDKSRAEWRFINDVHVLDTCTWNWNASDITYGTPPLPREDGAWAFDAKAARMVMYGGWANEWVGDCYTLDVAGIVGPPYAVTELEPCMGPYIGGTTVRVLGLNFVESKECQVKFTDGKHEEIVPGTVKSSTEIHCISPNWEKYGAGEVEVRVACRTAEGFTVNRIKWQFFVNTRPQKCIAYGPGIFEEGQWGFPAVFKIQAKDATGRDRTSGGDQFVATVKFGDMLVETQMLDNKDGTYDVTYVPLFPGEFSVEVTFEDPAQGNQVIPVRGSPWTVSFDDPWTHPKVQGVAPRCRPGIVASGMLKKMVMYGGEGETAVESLDTDTFTWTSYAADNAPVIHKGHSITQLDNDKLIVFGGQINGAEGEAPKLLNSVHILAADKDKWKWITPAEANGKAPTVRVGHCCAVIPIGKKLVVFGGQDAAGNLLDDVHILKAVNPQSVEWLPVTIEAAAEKPAAPEAPTPGGGRKTNPASPGVAQGTDFPAPAAEAAAPADGAAAPAEGGDAAPVEGGEGAEGGAPAAEGEAPAEGDGTGAGGEGGEGDDEEDGKPTPAQTAASNLAAERSRRLTDLPGARKDGACLFIEGNAFVVGGNASPVTSDVVVAAIDKNNAVTWNRPTITGPLPPPRTSPVVSVIDGKVYMYGGVGAEGEDLDDLWVLDSDTWTWKLMYATDGKWLGQNVVAAIVQGKKLISIASSRSQWDDVRVLEFGKKIDGNQFLPRMGVRIQQELRDLDKFLNGVLRDLKLDPASEQGEEKQFQCLLKCIHAMYDIKVQMPMTDLQFDVLRDAVAMLGKNGLNIERSEKDLVDQLERWADVKKAAPAAKDGIKPIQDREALKIRTNIQAFTDRMKDERRKFEQKAFYKFSTGSDAAYGQVLETLEELNVLEHQGASLKEYSVIFEFPELMKAPFDVLSRCKEDLIAIKGMWDNLAMIEYQFASWKETPWEGIETETIEDGTKAFFKQLRQADKMIKLTDVFQHLESNVKDFMASIPLVSDLRHPSMRERHWKNLMDVTNVQFVIDEHFKLGNLLDLGLHKFEEDVGEIVNQAQKEEKMEQALKKINETWAVMEFQFVQHKDTDLQLVKMLEEDFETLEDQQVQIQNMMSSRYLATFEEQVTSWQKKLATIADVMQIMTENQRTWAYLETLFIGSEEVKKELPEDTERFAGIDSSIRRILVDFNATKNVSMACNKTGLYEELEKLQVALQMCEKSLANYLEQKRQIFPRFFFVSTADLLDILSAGNSPRKIMTHLPKIIAAVQELDLEDGPTATDRPSASGLSTCVGVEHVDLSKKLLLAGRVEYYLQDVIESIAEALRELLFASIQDYAKKDREVWVLEVPNQIMLCTSLIDFTCEMELSFKALMSTNKNAMKDYLVKKSAQLTSLIELVRTDLTRGERMKVMCLITLDAHSRDIVENIIRENVEDLNAFQWQSQLRFRWDPNESDCFINICDAEFHYEFEYQGNGPRLVITPLTDRIYVTATQALHLGMGCAPSGPAGTGKTETTKDLAAMMGKCIYVFNCSPEMDYRSMGDIFKGLAASGAWGCFDEFNRLIAEVLSVCSTQYKAVLDAIREKKKTFVLMGATMTLRPTCGAYITMNPGYLGRQELPESLKVLFRPVTVVVPDMGLICENMLMAEGFTKAKILARKFVQLYSLLRDLLSKAMHYDWGLRAIKSVLVVAGAFKRSEPEQDEAALLYRALRDFNLPKIVGDDLVVFRGLLGDLFPGIDIPRKRDLDFERVIEECAVASMLQPEPDFLLKVVQLGELMQIRHCIFILGTSGTGKTQTWKMLQKANGKAGNKTTVKFLNPKAITTHEFYGYVQLSTREWKDGIFSTLMRDLAAMPDNNPKWIILDGDLDANWIESMNSVMDDNKLLTLASNERIQLKPSMRLVFELRDLRFGSPATVSRAGIVFITEGKQWLSFVSSWIDKRDDTPERKKIIQALFDHYVPETLKELKKNFAHLAPTLDFNMIQSLCYILDGLYTPENIPKITSEDRRILETYFVFAAVWAFGSGYSIRDGTDHRRNFSSWWKTKWTLVKFPSSKGSVYDYFVDKQTYKFAPWAQVVPQIEYSSETPMRQVTVPTGETVAIDYLMDLLIENKRGVLLVGPAGCGKTAMVSGKLRNLAEQENSDFLNLPVNFNYYTDSMSLQKVLEGPLEKKAGRNFGPPGARRLIYFIDDLNMPMLDPYDTQSPIALLRMHLDYESWYDRTKLALKVINNVQFVACMNPTAGSFIINPRLQRHFMTFAVGFPQSEALMAIFSTFLNGHLKMFSAQLADTAYCNKVIQAALELHAKVSSTFRKTATNFHYEFSVRHLANVFQGLLMSEPMFFTEQVQFASLWVHESERVYGDRLVTQADLVTYNKVVKDVGKKYFKDLDQNQLFPDTLIYCNCWKDLDEKSYNIVPSIEVLNKVLTDALTSYNETNAAMNLVLFGDAMRHVCRIARIMQNSNALLVGVGGSGKQSLARLAAFICGNTVMQIAISGTYGITDLKEDLKNMYNKAGIKGEPILFLFTDSQIADEKFLVYLNELLASGNIPDLFASDEQDSICGSVRNEAKGMGLGEAKDVLWDFFISKIRQNLHVALCFSPVGEAFRRRASRFPALINCTVIDWFQPWPEDALLSVAKRFMDDMELGNAEERAGITKFMPYSFDAVNKASVDYLSTEKRYNYTTPKSFLELIYLYKNMLAQQRKTMIDSIDRLENGLTKLQKTATDVAVLEDELKVKSVEVDEKKQAADQLMEKVGTEKAKVGEEAAKASVEAEDCAALAERCARQQRDCEADLAKAEPMVQQAEQALDSLNKKDLGELKSLAKPPAGVDDITAAILAIRGEKDRSWNNAKTMMKDVNKFIQELKDMKTLIDTSVISKGAVDASRPYLALEHFNQDTMKRKSNAAAGLCVFIINIIAYYDIVVTVEPKRKAAAAAQEELEGANTRLADVNEHVRQLQEQLAQLEAEFTEVVAEKDAVVAEAEKLQTKLDLAQRLMNALGSENERWATNVTKLKESTELLTGDVLLASAFVSYIGCFNKKYRTILMQDIIIPYMIEQKVPMSDNADPLAILTDPATVAFWGNEGLPYDRVSIENGAIATHCERWPLLIDPQLQGIAWIRERESKNNLQIVRLGQKSMLGCMERSLEQGFSVLIENIQESVDAVLAPIVGRNKIKKGRNFFVKVGDKEVEWSNEFHLFIHTKLSNPHYPPEIQAECTLINFTVTEDGLEDQLLAKVVQKERPELEESKASLIKQQNEFSIKLKELEDSLLKQLAEAQGDILEDVALIESLEQAKMLSIEINEKVIIAKDTEIKINEARELYRGVASRGALLFFILSDLFKIHSFYYYSLAAFTSVFLRAIDLAGKTDFSLPIVYSEAYERARVNPFHKFKLAFMSVRAGLKGALQDGKPVARAEGGGQDLSVRLEELMDSITFEIFDFTRAGLLERNKLLFATMVSFKVLSKQGMLDPKELDYLIQNKRSTTAPPLSGELAVWMSENAWLTAHGLQDLQPLSKLCADLEANAKAWQQWSDESQPERADMPGEYKALTPFQQMLVLRALRPDRLTTVLTAYISDRMGPRFTEQAPFEVISTYKTSSPETALFFYLFPGADVVKDLDPLLRKKGFTLDNGKFISISMGQGQEPLAEEALDRCMKEGGWVFLQNIHLMSTWVKALERKLEGSTEAHFDFRCFLSAEPPGDPMAQTIPESILQNAIKIANEPPQSLKANLVRSWNNFSQDFLDRATKKRELRTILLALCLFHALVLGRRRFGYLGWSRAYSFNDGDLCQCGDVLQNQLAGNAHVPWEDLRYIFGEIMYGGHITDKWDRRTNSTYLEVLLNQTLLAGADMCPDFPAPAEGNFTDILAYIRTTLPTESPSLFGLHPNAEIGFMSAESETLFRTLLELQGAAAGGGDGGGKDAIVAEKMADLLDRAPALFSMIDINSRIAEKTPFLVVLLQECERMNELLGEIRRSLNELKLGLEGALNISDAMEALSLSLFLDRIPPNWEKVAYPSMSALGSWYPNLVERVDQLFKWQTDLVTPPSVWVSALFNPMAFVTAVMQVTARFRGWPLDNVAIQTDITPHLPEAVSGQPEEGAFIHGLFLEGARWDTTAALLKDSFLKELYPSLPVMHVLAVPQEDKRTSGYYDCPVYYTQQRGGTFTFAAQLKTDEKVSKWVLAGVALLMNTV